MKEASEHIDRIHQKLQELLKKHSAQARQGEQQEKTIIRLEQRVALQEEKLHALEQQQHIYKAAAGKMEEGDRKKFEQLINKYIREIDKCINLLND